ncbi:MAG: sugar phosphate isomerase/epimerase [Phycisphaerae bacterium]|nr:sugar phosphate isomerase/epimerase [Phycisphaerae bacterium]
MERTGAKVSMTRRAWLKAAGAGAAVLAGQGCTLLGDGPLETPPRPDLKTKAARNLKLGIMSSVYASFPVDEAARRIREDGFASVVLEGQFADVQFDAAKPDWDAARKMMTALDKQGIRVAGLFGYYNVIDPVTERRRHGEQRMECLLKNWKRFGQPIISTETGSFNPQSEFSDHPDNYTEKGYLACRDAFARLARMAEKTGAIVAIEVYWRNVIDSIERAERLFKDVPSPSLKLTMDPCNYYRKDDLARMQPMLDEMFKRVGKQTVLAHAKDVKAAADGTDLPAAGQGVLDYPLYLRHLAALDKELDLVIEHLQLKDVARARDYVKSQYARV